MARRPQRLAQRVDLRLGGERVFGAPFPSGGHEPHAAGRAAGWRSRRRCRPTRCSSAWLGERVGAHVDAEAAVALGRDAAVFGVPLQRPRGVLDPGETAAGQTRHQRGAEVVAGAARDRVGEERRLLGDREQLRVVLLDLRVVQLVVVGSDHGDAVGPRLHGQAHQACGRPGAGPADLGGDEGASPGRRPRPSASRRATSSSPSSGPSPVVPQMKKPSTPCLDQLLDVRVEGRRRPAGPRA